MSKYLSDYNLHVLTNVISGVETYGQRYSDERNWSDFTPAYAATKNEVSITIGWAANYGEEARKLLQMIQTDYPNDFQQNDIGGLVAAAIKKPFTSQPYYQPAVGSTSVKAIVQIISSEGGKKTQDKLFGQIMETYLKRAIDYGINPANIKALMMWCEISHLGGSEPVKRIFNRCGTNPSMDAIMTALKKDQQDTSNGTQVGDKIFQSRHDCCYKWINQYAQTQQKGCDSMAIDFKNYYGLISNSGSDQNYDIAGGRAGDQTTHEWQVRTWYNRPWNCVLRYPDRKVGNLLAELGIEAAKNDLIGYDQYQRDTYWHNLQDSNYRPSQITVACQADCSAGVIANTKAVGYLLNIPALQRIAATYTGDMRIAYKNAGFEVLTDSKYLNGYDYLMPGDVLLNDVHHTATNLGIGAKSGYGDPIPAPAPQPEKEQPQEQQKQKKSSSLNRTPKYVGRVLRADLGVREWAGINHAKIKSWPKLHIDSLVDVCHVLKADDGKKWYYVRINGQFYGFVQAKYIDIIKKFS